MPLLACYFVLFCLVLQAHKNLQSTCDFYYVNFNLSWNDQNQRWGPFNFIKLEKPFFSLQKPLRRIDIEEISGKIVVPEGESGAYKPLVQEVVKEVEEASSPLSTSPSAKMIKIEELSEVPSQASEK